MPRERSRATSTALVSVDPRLIPGAYISVNGFLWCVIGDGLDDDGKPDATRIVLEFCRDGRCVTRYKEMILKEENGWKLERAPMTRDESQRLDDEVTAILANAANRAVERMA